MHVIVHRPQHPCCPTPLVCKPMLGATAAASPVDQQNGSGLHDASSAVEAAVKLSTVASQLLLAARRCPEHQWGLLRQGSALPH